MAGKSGNVTDGSGVLLITSTTSGSGNVNPPAAATAASSPALVSSRTIGRGDDNSGRRNLNASKLGSMGESTTSTLRKNSGTPEENGSGGKPTSSGLGISRI